MCFGRPLSKERSPLALSSNWTLMSRAAATEHRARYPVTLHSPLLYRPVQENVDGNRSYLSSSTTALQVRSALVMYLTLPASAMPAACLVPVWSHHFIASRRPSVDAGWQRKTL